jgi:hypothetical protein
MNYPNEKLYPVPELGGDTGRALRACGLWLRLGFIGASATAIGLLQLFGGETTQLSPLALTLGGVVLAVVGWRRAYTALRRADAEAPATPVAAPAQAPAQTPAVA